MSVPVSSGLRDPGTCHHTDQSEASITAQWPIRGQHRPREPRVRPRCRQGVVGANLAARYIEKDKSELPLLTYIDALWLDWTWLFRLSFIGNGWTFIVQERYKYSNRGSVFTIFWEFYTFWLPWTPIVKFYETCVNMRYTLCIYYPLFPPLILASQGTSWVIRYRPPSTFRITKLIKQLLTKSVLDT